MKLMFPRGTCRATRPLFDHDKRAVMAHDKHTSGSHLVERLSLGREVRPPPQVAAGRLFVIGHTGRLVAVE